MIDALTDSQRRMLLILFVCDVVGCAVAALTLLQGVSSPREMICWGLVAVQGWPMLVIGVLLLKLRGNVPAPPSPVTVEVDEVEAALQLARGRQRSASRQLIVFESACIALAGVIVGVAEIANFSPATFGVALIAFGLSSSVVALNFRVAMTT